MSQRDGRTETIDGTTFRVRFLDPFTANDMLVLISKTIGPALGEFAGGAMANPKAIASLLTEDGEGEREEGIGGDTEESSGELGRGLASAIRDLCSRLEAKDLRWMMEQLSEVSEVKVDEETWPTLKRHFQVTFRGKPGLMYKWLWFALEVNFADFFASVRSAIAPFGRLVKSAGSRSPNTSEDMPQ
jgi:hypothetical protein